MGVRHPDTLAALDNLGVTLSMQGKHAEAEPLFRRALAGYEAELGANHPRTLTSVNNLASLLHDQGKHEVAEQAMAKATQLHNAVLAAWTLF